MLDVGHAGKVVVKSLGSKAHLTSVHASGFHAPNLNFQVSSRSKSCTGWKLGANRGRRHANSEDCHHYRIDWK
jgi:hypothetical protein